MVTFILFLIIAVITKKEEEKLDLSLNTLYVESSAFAHNNFMPTKYTGRGEDISPELILTDILPDAKSIAMIMISLLLEY